MRNKKNNKVKIINKIKTQKQTDITLFEISFSGLKNITSKKKCGFIVVDLDVLEILKLWRHMCGARILSIRSTWCNEKESIRCKRVVYVNMKEKNRDRDTNFSFISETCVELVSYLHLSFID